MKNLIRKILVESAKEKFINTILSRIKPPYFKNLKKLAADDQEIEIISKMIFGEDITMVNDLSSGDYKIINDEGNSIYFEDSNGNWDKWEYDDRGNEIYYENSNGYWVKKQYDGRGNQIYHENSHGYWDKWEYDGRGNMIYFEDSDGHWRKWERDDRGNLIYYEDSGGYWAKKQYDERGNLIYHETSIRGVIVDKR